MSNFKAKMHQNRFRLGLRPRPRWGSLQRSPGPLAGFKGPSVYLLIREGDIGREGRGKRGGRQGGGEGNRGRRGGEGKEGRKEGEGTPVYIFK